MRPGYNWDWPDKPKKKKKWEHARTLTTLSVLDKMSEAGWELVTVYDYNAYWKRRA